MMKAKILLLILTIVLFFPALSIAGNPYQIETTSDAIERRSAERYYQRQDNDGTEPLGGYSTTINGDSTIDYSSGRNRRDSSQDYSPFETIEYSQERHSVQQYEERQRNPYHTEPMGGYSEKLGDPAPQNYSTDIYDGGW